jgi:DNA-binding MarR family transcriptional regulator
MKKPLEPYELTQTELETLKEIVRSPASISELAKRVRTSQPTMTFMIGRLQKKGFVNVERQGMKKIVTLSQSKHAQLFKQILLEYPHVPWESILAFSGTMPLLRAENVTSVHASRITEWRALRNLMAHGIVSNNGTEVQASPRFHKVTEFIREYLSFINSTIAVNVSNVAAISWANGS